jgi:hypothetical protein
MEFSEGTGIMPNVCPIRMHLHIFNYGFNVERGRDVDVREINMNLEMRIILCSHEFGQVVGRTDAVAHPARRGVIHL